MLPGQVDRIALAQQADGLAVHLQVVVVQGDVALEAAEGGVEAGEVGQRLEVAEVVDGFDAQALVETPLEQRTNQSATDAPISIQGDTQHDILLPVVLLSA
ncbi:hypothetical protein D9M68_429960 [compost metagenome]